MFEWSDIHVFLAVTRTGSFTAAAKQLHVDQTTVGRRITALEARLGARLFRRGRDGLALTSTGRDVLPIAEQMEAAASTLSLTAAGRDQVADGNVRLTTFPSFASYILGPFVHELYTEHPGLVLDLHCDDRALSLTRREADIAIRTGKPAQAGLTVRRLTRAAYAVYGARRSKKLDPAHGPYVGLDDDAPPDLPQTRWIAARGAKIVFRSNQSNVLAAAVEGGLGLGVLPCYIADAMPGLVRVVEPADCVQLDVWMVVHGELTRTPRVRAVIAWVDRVVEQSASLLAGR